MPATVLVTVCLPATVPTKELTTTATAELAAHAAGRATPVGHFATSVHGWGKRHLVQPSKKAAAGGPVHLLDFDTMRNQARAGNWYRWQIWHRVAAGTPIAKPHSAYLTRHRNEPKKYSIAQAQQDYLTQPRLVAMRTYNALPNRILALPTAHLEGFQAGADTYAHLGWLSAVPGHAMITPSSEYLTPVSDNLADLVTYFQKANACLSTMGRRDQLLAFATTR